MCVCVCVCVCWKCVYKKVKWSRYSPDVAQREGRGIALLFHDRGTRRSWVFSSMPRSHFTPRDRLGTRLQEAGWPQSRSGREENLVSAVIRSRTVQPVVSRYTDRATGPTFIHINICILLQQILPKMNSVDLKYKVLCDPPWQKLQPDNTRTFPVNEDDKNWLKYLWAN